PSFNPCTSSAPSSIPSCCSQARAKGDVHTANLGPLRLCINAFVLSVCPMIVPYVDTRALIPPRSATGSVPISRRECQVFSHVGAHDVYMAFEKNSSTSSGALSGLDSMVSPKARSAGGALPYIG